MSHIQCQVDKGQTVVGFCCVRPPEENCTAQNVLSYIAPGQFDPKRHGAELGRQEAVGRRLELLQPYCHLWAATLSPVGRHLASVQ